MGRSYNALTRLLVLEDGEVFIHLTTEQFRWLLKEKPGLKIWKTNIRYIEDCESDIYGGRRIWQSGSVTMAELAFAVDGTSTLEDYSYAVCVPLEEYNNPEWGPISP